MFNLRRSLAARRRIPSPGMSPALTLAFAAAALSRVLIIMSKLWELGESRNVTIVKHKTCCQLWKTLELCYCLSAKCRYPRCKTTSVEPRKPGHADRIDILATYRCVQSGVYTDPSVKTPTPQNTKNTCLCDVPQL